MPKNAYLLPVLFSTLLALLVWALIAFPRTVEHEWQGPLKSASFAPFRDGQSPMKNIFPTPQEVESDLVLLKGKFEGIRTYTARNGMEVVPELAAKHGFHLTHSAWLGRDESDNNKEVDALIAAANQYPQAIQRVLVGNEVLLRRDLTPEQLIAHIDRVQAAIQQPVSYADVWAFWLQHPQVADHVDYITIHILPYWEDEPVSVAEGEKHMLAIIQRIKERFPGKPILVGETGWPTQGRSRGPAAANLLNAAEYVRHLPALAEQYQFDYNVVEAFDQTWKARNEGTVGARWGLLDAQRQEKYPLTGKVIPIDNAVPRIATSTVLGLLLALFLVRGLSSTKRAVVIASLSQLFAASLVYSIYTAVQLIISPASFTWLQQYWLFYGASVGWFSDASVKYLYELLLLDLVDKQAFIIGWSIALFAVFFAVCMVLWLRSLITTGHAGKAARFARSAYGIYGIGAVVYCYMFANAGRYMDVPLPHLLLPLAAALLLWALNIQHNNNNSTDFQLFTRCNFYNRFGKLIMTLAAAYCIYGEVNAMKAGQDFINAHPTLDLQIPFLAASTLANHELLAWCVACILLALPLKATKQSL